MKKIVFVLILNIVGFAAFSQIKDSLKIRFNGIYQSCKENESYHNLRFYSDGTVITVGTISNNALKMSSWFNKKKFTKPYHSKGIYEIRNQEINFISTSKEGSVVYNGKIINDFQINFQIKSLINGHESEKAFFFILDGDSTLNVSTAFLQAETLNTIKAYEHFINNYPYESLVSEATRSIEMLREWEKADSLNTILSFEKFIEKYPNDPQLTQLAKKSIEEIKWINISNENDTLKLTKYIQENPNSEYLQEALAALDKIRKEAKEAKVKENEIVLESEFNLKLEKIVSIDGLNKFVDDYKDSLYATYNFFYVTISKIEDLIIQDIQINGPLKRFQINDIKPYNDVTIQGKCAIVGNGNLAIAENCCDREGEGSILTLIAPIVEGSELNIMLGDIKYNLKNIKFGDDPNNDSFGEIDQSANFAPGAYWENISNILYEGKIRAGNGVAFSKGIRIGSLYGSDGNIVIEYIKSRNYNIICPAGTHGSVHRLIGEINIGEYTFIGANDPLYPLTFLLHKEYGYVYIRGKGKVITPDGSVKEF